MPVVSWGCGLGFAVIVAGGGGETGITVRINTDFAPILCCTGIINARQATATGKRIIADAGDAVGNGDARQATAIVERPMGDAGNAAVGWNYTIFASENQGFVCRLNQAIACGMIGFISAVYCNARQVTATTSERIIADVS